MIINMMDKRPMRPYSAKFEIDIISALSSQLIDAFEDLDIGALDPATLSKLERGQGVYKLFLAKQPVYVGKADNLPKRLTEHRFKILGRHGLNVADMGFKCLYVHENWTTLAPEASLIRHYKTKTAGDCEWNGNSFGPHDPGRNREITNKAPDGFDRLHPIREDWPCDWITAKRWNLLELLVAFKDSDKLPYTLRYETEHLGGDKYADYRKGHPDQRTATVDVPSTDMPAVELLKLITKSLPGWQSTAFPSHLILYKEAKDYKHGRVIHREP